MEAIVKINHWFDEQSEKFTQWKNRNFNTRVAKLSQKIENVDKVVPSLAAVRSLDKIGMPEEGRPDSRGTSICGGFTTLCVRIAILILIIITIQIFFRFEKQWVAGNPSQFNYAKNSSSATTLDLPAFRLQVVNKLTFFEAGPSSLQAISVADGDGSLWKSSFSQIPRATSAYSSVSIPLGSTCSILDLQALRSENQADKFDSSLRALLTPELQAFFPHNFDVYVRFDDEQLDQLKKCQLQISLVNNAEYAGLRQRNPSSDCNSLPFPVTNTTFTTLPSTWKFDARQCRGKREKQCWNMLKLSGSVDNLLHSALTTSYPGQETMNWKIMVNYVNNFRRLASDTTCGTVATSVLTREAWYAATTTGLTGSSSSMTVQSGFTNPQGFVGQQILWSGADSKVYRVTIANVTASSSTSTTFGVRSIALFAPPTRPSSPPSTWTCPAAYYGATDGCDCECGAVDPDCERMQSYTYVYGCYNPGQSRCSSAGRCTYSLPYCGTDWLCNLCTFDDPGNFACSGYTFLDGGGSSTGKGSVLMCPVVVFPGEVFTDGVSGLKTPKVAADFNQTCDVCPFDCLESGRPNLNDNGQYVCQIERYGNIDASLQNNTLAQLLSPPKVDNYVTCASLFPDIVLGNVVCNPAADSQAQLTVMKTLGFSNCENDGTNCTDIQSLCRPIDLTLPKRGFPLGTFIGQPIRFSRGQGNEAFGRLMKIETANLTAKIQRIWVSTNPNPKLPNGTFFAQACVGIVAGSVISGDFQLGVLMSEPDSRAACFPQKGPYPLLLSYRKPKFATASYYYGATDDDFFDGGGAVEENSGESASPNRKRRNGEGDDYYGEFVDPDQAEPEEADQANSKSKPKVQSKSAFELWELEMNKETPFRPAPKHLRQPKSPVSKNAHLLADLMLKYPNSYLEEVHPLKEDLKEQQTLFSEYKMRLASRNKKFAEKADLSIVQSRHLSGPQRRGVYHKEVLGDTRNLERLLETIHGEKIEFGVSDFSSASPKKTSKLSKKARQMRSAFDSSGMMTVEEPVAVDPNGNLPGGGDNYATVEVLVDHAKRASRIVEVTFPFNYGNSTLSSSNNSSVSFYQTLVMKEALPRIPQLTPWGTLSYNDFTNLTQTTLRVRTWSTTSFASFLESQGGYFTVVSPSTYDVEVMTVVGVSALDSMPTAWSCSPAYYNAKDGCDCDCGAYDPDCAVPTPATFSGPLFCSSGFYYCFNGVCDGTFGCTQAGACQAGANLGFSPQASPLDRGVELLHFSKPIPPFLDFDRVVTALPNQLNQLSYLSSDWLLEHDRTYSSYLPEDRRLPQSCEPWQSPDSVDLDFGLFLYPIKQDVNTALSPICDVKNSIETTDPALITRNSLVVFNCNYTELRSRTNCNSTTRDTLRDIFDQDFDTRCLDEMPPTSQFTYTQSTPVNQKYRNIDEILLRDSSAQYVVTYENTFVFTHDSDANTADSVFRGGRPAKGDRLETCNSDRSNCTCTVRRFSGSVEYQGLGNAVARPPDLPANLPLYYFEMALVADVPLTTKLAKDQDTWPSGKNELEKLLASFESRIQNFDAASVGGSTKRQGLPIAPGLEFSLKAFVNLSPQYSLDLLENLVISGWDTTISSTSVAVRPLDYNDRYDCRVKFEVQFSENSRQTINQPDMTVKQMIDGIGASLAFAAVGFALMETWQNWGGYVGEEKKWVFPYEGPAAAEGTEMKPTNTGGASSSNA